MTLPAGAAPPSDALARARHILLAGNGLPARWRGRERFVILATRFGQGDSFLAAWDAFRQGGCGRLVFVAIEAQPPSRSDLARAHAASPLPALAAQLTERWPPLTPGLHTLRFEGGAVELLLGLGDTRTLLRELVLQADAFILDDPAGDGTPEPWDAHLLKSLARHAAPGAIAAGASAAPALRRHLTSAGFEVSEAPGWGGAGPMSVARFAPRHRPQRPAGREPLAAGARRALVLGAGLAGAASALALSRAGVACTVIDALGAPAQASSGNPAGLFHGTLNPDDGLHARFNRAAALATRASLAALGLPELATQPGLLRLETRRSLPEMQALLHGLDLPADYVQALSAEAASAIAGGRFAQPAWFYPGGGALDPGAYTRAMLAASGAELRLNTAVAGLHPAEGGWALLNPAGATIAQAPLLVLAGGHAHIALLGGLAAHLTLQRGQLTHLPQAPWCPTLPVAGDGYVIADGQGGVWCGATTQDGDLDPDVRAADQQDNLARYARLAATAVPPAVGLSGRVGWRLLAPDRLPLIGGLAAPGMRAAQLRQQARQPGLLVCSGFASRGIGWAALAGELVAALALGGPRPLEADLLDAVDPERFAMRHARRPVA